MNFGKRIAVMLLLGSILRLFMPSAEIMPSAHAQIQVTYSRSGASVTPDPTFSPVSPYSGSATSVTISDAAPSAGPAATILYCTDTINSCTPSTAYTGAISVSSTEYIRAQAQYLGVPASNVVSWQGTIATGNPTFNAGYTNNSSSNAVTGTIATTAGDLIWLQSKTTPSGQTLTISNTSGPACTWNPVLSSPVSMGAIYVTQAFYCIAPTTGTWSGHSHVVRKRQFQRHCACRLFAGVDVHRTGYVFGMGQRRYGHDFVRHFGWLTPVDDECS